MSVFDTFTIEVNGARAINRALKLYAEQYAVEFPDRDGTWTCCWFTTVVGARPQKCDFTFEKIAWWKSSTTAEDVA